jgi:hypothetical protein
LNEVQTGRAGILSPTLREGLKAYAVGRKDSRGKAEEEDRARGTRPAYRLSPAMRSKIKRGQVFPILPTLLRIALVFSVGLDFFFSGNREKPIVGVVRHKDRLRSPEKPGTRDIGYMFESLDYPAVERYLNGYHVESLPVAEQKWRCISIPAVSSFTCSPAR